MSSILRIIVFVMTNAEINVTINEYNERERARRNRMLQSRLACPRSREELLRRLGGLADEVVLSRSRQIPLTNAPAHYIMECAR